MGERGGRRESLEQLLEQLTVEKANLWSYIALSSIRLSIAKGSGGDVGRLEREELEKLVKASSQAFAASAKRVEGLLREVEDALLKLGYEVRKVKAKLSSRGLFGVGAPFGRAAFDVGLSFDPILNVPFIPGSTIKGAVRSAYAALGGSKEDEERLFGSTSVGAGLVEFTDAYPVELSEEGYLLYPDVLTPHYRGAETELDAQPVPVVYLTVAPGTTFQFYVYFKLERGDRSVKLEQGGDLAVQPEPDAAKLGLLDLAILYALGMGVGAKTSAGYSALKVVEYTPVRPQAGVARP